uniref:Uncharacterized protein n=1 Tax=Oryza meridionalis TaxID=40149 RepID=A0A0E0EA22_9ORYZ
MSAENPAIWKEFNRKEGQLELLRVGKKNGGMVISDRVDGGASGSSPRQGCLVMKTYEKAQEYYHELWNKDTMASGAGVKTEGEGKAERDNEDEKAKAMARAMLRPNKGVKIEDDSETESDNDDEKPKAMAMAKARAILRPNKGSKFFEEMI